MFIHANDPDIDLNQRHQSFENVGNRFFPRFGCSFDATGYSTDSHSTEPPRSNNSDNLGVAADQHKYYTETCHEMRNPAVDPRKSRRHGTDFGLGRYAESSLTVLNSDPRNPSKAISVSASMTAMQDTATDGDSVSSLFECSTFDFPQPPPIGSPVIRRMRSSPWFSDKHCITEGFSNQGSRKPRRSASVLLNSDFCYSVSSFVTQQSRMKRDNLRSGHHNFSNLVDETANAEGAKLHLSPYLEFTTDDIGLEMVGEALVGLDMNTSNLGPQQPFLENPAYGGPSIEFSQASDPGRQFAKPSHLDWSIPSDLLHWSISHRSAPLMLAPTSQQRVSGEDTLQNDGYRGHIFRTKTKPVFSLPSEPQAIRSLGRLPRIIRKVASMKSDSRTDDAKCIPLGSTGSRTIPKSRSFRSVPCETGSNASTTDVGPYQHSSTNLDCFSSSKHSQDPFSPTLNDSFRAFEDCKRHDSQQMPLPSSGLISEAVQQKAKVTILPMALSSPFVHRETCNRPLIKRENDLPNEMDKSFMDITPNQGTKHERSAAATKRARVRKLIARASNGIIGWGRHLTRRTPSNSSH